VVKTKFTPGPWQYDEYDVFATDPHDGDDVVICAVGRTYGFRSSVYNVASHNRTILANGQAIAALPDLYVALEAMVEPYNGWDDVQLRKRTDPATYKRVKNAFAALTKTRGES
jgi:hypothetical protein